MRKIKEFHYFYYIYIYVSIHVSRYKNYTCESDLRALLYVQTIFVVIHNKNEPDNIKDGDICPHKSQWPFLPLECDDEEDDVLDDETLPVAPIP
ncbi:hypothetical protein CJ030_MR1G029325 [Morella rubra]|uniref:Uncharacterized protein n=1 Tax=Morella rubra TaxID=262757 RepID=A0A6A1WLN2_9ROSI|nr:hypothetical protein CJ030_MR1G029325 [Morella rubra]